MLQAKLTSPVGAMRCDPGFGCDDDDNQDAVLLETLDSGIVVACIFDGHGSSGKLVAEACRSHLIEAVNKHMPADTKAPGADWMGACVESLEKHVTSAVSDIAESGSTATIVLYLPASRQLLAANVGDSKAVIYDGQSAPLTLTVDHYPHVEEERCRIETAGGRVAASDDVQLGELGEVRVWKGASSAPGLTISRSVGDAVAKTVGVTCNASTKAVEPPGAAGMGPTRVVIIGSAGIWKIFSPRDLVEVVAREANVEAAAEAVIVEARNRWEELWQGENTSLVLLALPA